MGGMIQGKEHWALQTQDLDSSPGFVIDQLWSLGKSLAPSGSFFVYKTRWLDQKL